MYKARNLRVGSSWAGLAHIIHVPTHWGTLGKIAALST